MRSILLYGTKFNLLTTCTKTAFYAVSLTALAVGSLDGAEPGNSMRSEQPPVGLAAEPLLPDLSLEKVTEFLDAGARAAESKCINCHATFAYLMARPALPISTDKHGEVRKNLEAWVAYLEGLELDRTSDSRRCAEAVMSGAVLAQTRRGNDR